MNLPHRYAARIYRNDLVVEAGETPLMLGDQGGLKAAVAVAQNVEPQWPLFGQHHLGTAAIALVALRIGFRGAGWVPEVMTELAAEGAFDEYPPEIRKAIYTTTAVESLNSVIRAATKRSKVFPSDDSARKVIYLAIAQASKQWTMSIQN